MMTKEYFEEISKKITSWLEPDEWTELLLNSEQSQFIRINGTHGSARIRQTGSVNDSSLTLTLLKGKEGELKKSSLTLTLTGLSYIDLDPIRSGLMSLRSEVKELPIDPFAQVPKKFAESFKDQKSKLLSPEHAASEIISVVSKLDISGIYASGRVIRAMSSSTGTFHWFATDVFSFDYSLYTPNQKAVKATYAGTKWDQSAFQANLGQAQEKLALLNLPSKVISLGNHRTFLEPACVNDLIQMFSWGCIGEQYLRQGDSPLRKFKRGDLVFSPQFSLSEDFSGGESPRFNEEGASMAEVLPLIQSGKLTQTLVSDRTSKEYQVASNFAPESEVLRSPSVAPGTLSHSKVLQELDTGLYLSNLHYLNWSDQKAGRITGMTRYACFWVEGGKMVAPIENLRWDDTIFRLFGENCLSFTQEREFIPEVGTYGMRHLGGMKAPGLLLKEMNFTL